MSWILRMLGLRGRPDVATPPPTSPDSLADAKAIRDHAAEVLDSVTAQDYDVETRHQRARKIRRENNLGPAFMRVLGRERET